MYILFFSFQSHHCIVGLYIGHNALYLKMSKLFVMIFFVAISISNLLYTRKSSYLFFCLTIFLQVAIVTPFNFPLEIPVLQLMGALYMGNKPLLKVDSKVFYVIVLYSSEPTVLLMIILEWTHEIIRSIYLQWIQIDILLSLLGISNLVWYLILCFFSVIVDS